MPWTARPLRDRRTWSDSRAASIVALAFLAAATIAARLPFLLRGPRFFASDEAVDGLMARHVLTGEHPMFLLVLRYKGGAEVYLTAVPFHWSPASSVSVVALTAVTVGCCA